MVCIMNNSIAALRIGLVFRGAAEEGRSQRRGSPPPSQNPPPHGHPVHTLQMRIHSSQQKYIQILKAFKQLNINLTFHLQESTFVVPNSNIVNHDQYCQLEIILTHFLFLFCCIFILLFAHCIISSKQLVCTW